MTYQHASFWLRRCANVPVNPNDLRASIQYWLILLPCYLFAVLSAVLSRDDCYALVTVVTTFVYWPSMSWLLSILRDIHPESALTQIRNPHQHEDGAWSRLVYRFRYNIHST